MLILPMLPGSTSSPVSPSKYSSPATDTERAGQATDTSGFGAILAHEMNEKDDISDARLAKGEKALSSVPADAAVKAEELQGQNEELLKDNRETGSNTAIALTGLQPMDLASILPGLPVAGAAEVRIDTEAFDRSDIGSNLSTVIRPGALQMDFTGTALQPTDLAPLQQGLVAGYTALTEVDTAPDSATVAVGGKASQIQTPVEAQIKLALAKETQAIGTENSTGSELESRQRLPQPTDFTFRKFSLANEIEKAGNEKAGTPVLEQAPDLLTAALPSTLASPATSVTAEHSSALVAGNTVGNDVLRLEPRIGATGWDNALSQKVLWMVSDGRQIAELNLNPPDLGPLQVVLSITDDQASATFISQHADVRNALEAALPRLKEMMAESGLQLSNTTVSSDSPQQQKGFERHDAGVRHDGEGGRMLASEADISGSHIRSGGSSLVDTFA